MRNWKKSSAKYPVFKGKEGVTMNSSFEYTTTLEYRLKAAKAELEAFKSGEKYIVKAPVDTTVENHYRGWNIPSVEYWIPFKPLED